MDQALILSDIHGCYDEMIELISQAPEGIRIIIAGDLIDRGPDTRKVINYVRDNAIECVMGNHELMLIEQYKNGNLEANNYELAMSDWTCNGGHDVYNQYLTTNDIPVLIEDAKYLSALPLVIKTGIIDKDGLELLVSHGYTANKDIDYILANPDLTADNVTWDRTQPAQTLNKSPYYNVFGHTPLHYVNRKQYSRIQGEVIPEPNFYDGAANIDTGCAYSTRGGGWLSGLLFPSLYAIQVKRKDPK